MGDIRAAESALAALEERLALLRTAPPEDNGSDSADDDADVFEREDALRFLQDALGDGGATSELLERLRARLSVVDPVTQQPRFGPKTTLRVQDIVQRYDAVRAAMDADAHLAARVESQAARRRERAAERQTRNEQEREHALRALEMQREREAQEERRRVELVEHEEQQRVAALAALAQQKREERAREKQEEERRAQEARERDEQRRAAFPVGTLGLERAIALLRESTGSADALRLALQKLHAVVANVCAAPENAAFRRIPRDNANFYRDLGQYDGGHQCLFALGFQEHADPDSEGTVIFTLEEPDLAVDLDAWSAWFDNLKAMSAFIEGKLQG